jgi:hypothetical protein
MPPDQKTDRIAKFPHETLLGLKEFFSTPRKTVGKLPLE